jgi:hypothetical protein
MIQNYGVRLLIQVVAEDEQAATIELTPDTIMVRGERREVQNLTLAACEAAFDAVSRVMKIKEHPHGQG